MRVLQGAASTCDEVRCLARARGSEACRTCGVGRLPKPPRVHEGNAAPAAQPHSHYTHMHTHTQSQATAIDKLTARLSPELAVRMCAVGFCTFWLCGFFYYVLFYMI